MASVILNVVSPDLTAEATPRYWSLSDRGSAPRLRPPRPRARPDRPASGVLRVAEVCLFSVAPRQGSSPWRWLVFGCESRELPFLPRGSGRGLQGERGEPPEAVSTRVLGVELLVDVRAVVWCSQEALARAVPASGGLGHLSRGLGHLQASLRLDEERYPRGGRGDDCRLQRARAAEESRGVGRSLPER